jgi:hypothetical protein
LAPLACHDDAEEAKQVLGRIDRMRDASLAERGPLIAKLAELAPEGAEAKTARRACLDAYQKLQAAHDEVARTSARIEEMKAKGRAPRYEEITAADRATSMMREAKKAEPACTRAVAALRRKLR